MVTMPRILLVADLSQRTREALKDAALLHRRWGTLVDAYYLWENANDLPADSPARTIRELEAFSKDRGAWQVLDELGELDRSGVVAIRGYLTLARPGQTLSELAVKHGYLGIMYGTAADPPPSRTFALHGAPPAFAPSVRARSVVSIAVSRAPDAPAVSERRDRIRSHAR